MMVFIVCHGNGMIEGVFSTREGAREAVRLYKQSSPACDYCIIERVVDAAFFEGSAGVGLKLHSPKVQPE